LWLPKKNGAFTVGPAPDPTPDAKQIVVRTRAVAVNPVDRMLPALGSFITPWLVYPAVLGTDVAGEVIAVGSGVTRFKPGDRVVAFAASGDKGHTAAEGAFQEQVLVQDHMTAPIPDALSFEAAAVLPLGICTAATGLFQKDYLGLRHPSAAATPVGETLVVWGGSTSVGSNAIQLAAAAGYDVVTTCSPRNFDFVKRLGASAAFDYNSKTVVADMIAALRGRTLAGAYALGTGAEGMCADILGASKGGKFVASASPAASFDLPPSGRISRFALLPVLVRMGLANMALARKKRRAGVTSKFIWGSTLQDNEVGPMIFEDFLPRALAEGRYRAAPEPTVVGKGLEAIPKALEQLGRGVSASKLVVSL
jgi:NADPH:quinone reductase-like Zn-dependent oxidoreductase